MLYDYPFAFPSDTIIKYDYSIATLWNKRYSYPVFDSVGSIIDMLELPGGNYISVNEVPDVAEGTIEYDLRY